MWGSSSPAYDVINCDLFNILENDISYFDRLGTVLIAGDFNGRVGLIPDYIINDNHVEDIDSISYIADIAPRRTSMDRQSNGQGLQLIDLCKMTSLRICNGRFLNTDSFTYYGHGGNSVIDYLLCRYESFEMISSLRVSDFNEFSDHALLQFEIAVNKNIGVNHDYKQIRQGSKIEWKEDKIHEFRRGIIADLPQFNELLLNDEQESIDRENIDNLVEKFVNLINKSSHPLFKKDTYTRKKTGRITRSAFIQSEWFDEDCRVKKGEYIECLKQFNQCKSTENRTKLCEKKREYKSVINMKKRRYKVMKSKEIESLKSKSPRDFWNFFSKRKQQCGENITIEQFYNYFKDISEQFDSAPNPRADDFNTRDMSQDTPAQFEELDSYITVQEVLGAIKNLKRNKAYSTDEMIYAYFISTSDILAGHLADLFNKIFMSGIFPSSWMEGIVVPLYKKGEKGDVNNYRGITLTSCLSKIYTGILNKRLSCWSAENDVISDAQFGFKKGFSTTDAIFSLHCLIEHNDK